MHPFPLTVIAATLALAHSAYALDLGVIGPTYPISEPHLLEFIEQRLTDKARSGALQRLQEQARAKGIDAVLHPAPLSGIRPTDTARTFYVDPSVILERNIVDANGTLLFAAGTKKNPLDVVSLSKHLLFFDARDPQQVTRARALMAQYQGRVKPILVGGSYLELMKAWRIPIYYDQHGRLTQRLQITQVPALVSQEGPRLRIDELVR